MFVLFFFPWCESPIFLFFRLKKLHFFNAFYVVCCSDVSSRLIRFLILSCLFRWLRSCSNSVASWVSSSSDESWISWSVWRIGTSVPVVSESVNKVFAVVKSCLILAAALLVICPLLSSNSYK